MGVVTINGEGRLAVFGGRTEENRLDSVEFYNTKKKNGKLQTSN